MTNPVRLARSAALVCTMLAMIGAAPAQQGPGVRRQIDASLVREFAGTKGLSRPSQDALMRFPQPTQIKEVRVRGGQQVRKGDLLVRGDDAEDDALLRLQQMRADSDLPVRRAEKARDLATAEYENLKKVRSGGGSSDFEVERARLQHEVSIIDWETAKLTQEQERLQVQRLAARLERLRLAAPFDGWVDQVAADIGHSVSESEPVVRIVDVDPLFVDVPAPMEDPSTLSLRPGDRAWVLVDVSGEGRLLLGDVVEVAPTSDPASRTRRVRIEVPNPDGPLRVVAGEPAWVRFTEPAGPVLKRLGAEGPGARAGAGGR